MGGRRGAGRGAQTRSEEVRLGRGRERGVLARVLQRCRANGWGCVWVWVWVCLGVWVCVWVGVWVCLWVCGCVSGWVGRWREKEREVSRRLAQLSWRLAGAKSAGWACRLEIRHASAAVQIQRLIASRGPDRSLLWVLAGGLCLC